MSIYLLIIYTITSGFTFKGATDLDTVCNMQHAQIGKKLILKIELPEPACAIDAVDAVDADAEEEPARTCSAKYGDELGFGSITCEKYQPPRVWREAGGQ